MLSIKRILHGGPIKRLNILFLALLFLLPLSLSFSTPQSAIAGTEDECHQDYGIGSSDDYVLVYVKELVRTEGSEPDPVYPVLVCGDDINSENVKIGLASQDSSRRRYFTFSNYTSNYFAFYYYQSEDGEVRAARIAYVNEDMSADVEPIANRARDNMDSVESVKVTVNDPQNIRPAMYETAGQECPDNGSCLEGSVTGVDDGTAEEEDQTCESQAGAVGWITCSLLRLTASTLDILDRTVVGLLKVEEAYLNSPSTEAIWKNIRNLAYLILVPIVLFMVIATALGFDFISAYTVKKTLPRLVIATIFIALSFELTKFAIIFVNDISTGFLGLMSGAGSVNSLQELFEGNLRTDAGLTALVVGGGAAAIAGAGGMMGAFWALVGFLAIAALAILFVVLLLAARQAIIVMLAIVAPLAVLSWIFPGNDKLWNLWKDSFGKLLILFPIIMITLGAGRFFAGLVGGFEGESFPESFINTILKLAAYVLPYFLIPFLFKTAGGLFSNLTGMLNNREKGLLDRTRNWAGERQKPYKEDRERRKQYNMQRKRHNSAGYRQRLKGAAMGDMTQLNDFTRDRISKPKTSAWRDAEHGILAAQLAKSDPKTAAGEAQQAAAEIRIKAAAFTSASKIQDDIKGLIGTLVSQQLAAEHGLDPSSIGGKLTNTQARKIVLNRTRDYIIDNAETMGTEEFIGTVNALSKQQAGKQIMEIHESMDTVEKARKWGDALSHGDTYAGVTKLNAGTGFVGVGEGRTSEIIAAERARENAKQKPAKLSGMSKDSWQEMLDYAYAAQSGAIQGVVPGHDMYLTVAEVEAKMNEVENLLGDRAADLERPAGPRPNNGSGNRFMP